EIRISTKPLRVDLVEVRPRRRAKLPADRWIGDHPGVLCAIFVFPNIGARKGTKEGEKAQYTLRYQKEKNQGPEQQQDVFPGFHYCFLGGGACHHLSEFDQCIILALAAGSDVAVN